MITITDLFRLARTLFATALIVSAASVCAQAQFSSGSTGADGDFNPTTSQTIIVPDSGVFNFKTVNIPLGVTITFLRNAKNTPLVILATGDVTITGRISVEGRNGTGQGNGGFGGPGGFNGGAGASGYDFFNGQPGDGPGGGGGGVANTNTSQRGSGGGGGGHASAGASSISGAFVASGGQRYGTSTLQPLTGGSGGGGGSATFTNGFAFSGGGGGGGGALLIASSTKITNALNASISADGGDGACTNCSATSGGGGGAGGAIRLIANEVVLNGPLSARGGGGSSASGGVGYIRLEAFNLTVAGTINPAPVTSLPGPVTATALPTLRITKVAGVDAPANPSGSFSATPDVVIPASQSNPVAVEFATTNIPVGTTIQVTVTPASGARTTTTSSGITGTDAAGTATASVTLSNGLSIINATATFALPQNVSLIIDGERVNRVEVGTTWGGPSEVTYITESGKRIKRKAE